jgi:hypothetical protein
MYVSRYVSTILTAEGKPLTLLPTPGALISLWNDPALFHRRLLYCMLVETPQPPTRVHNPSIFGSPYWKIWNSPPFPKRLLRTVKSDRQGRPGICKMASCFGKGYYFWNHHCTLCMVLLRDDQTYAENAPLECFFSPSPTGRSLTRLRLWMHGMTPTEGLPEMRPFSPTPATEVSGPPWAQLAVH